MENVVVITGGANGIGKAIAISALDEGARVFIIDNDKDAGSKITKKLGVTYYEADVTDSQKMRDAANNIGTECGNVSHLVSCAGRALPMEFGSFDRITTDLWDKSISVNLSGHFYFIKAFSCLLDKKSDNTVTLISSINALQGYGLVPYSSAKAGLLGFMHSIVKPFGEIYNARVNCVLPGTVIPSDKNRVEVKDYDSLKSATYNEQLTSETDVAEGTMSLIYRMPMVTGVEIIIDGGQTVINNSR